MAQHSRSTAACGTQSILPPSPVSHPQLSPKESGVNEYWQAIFLHNSAEPISSVAIDGRPLKLET